MAANRPPVRFSTSVGAILREFLTRSPRPFALLFAVLMVEGVVSTISVLALVPLADFLLDPTLSHSSKVTRLLVQGLSSVGVSPSFWAFGLLFVGSNLAKGLFDIGTRYAVLRIKYSVTRGLFGDALATFFRARWEFFSGADQGRLLNTLNRELSTIGDTLGHFATQMAQAVQLCIYMVVPFWLSPRMTLTALGLSVLFGSPLLFLHRTSYRLGRKNTESANVMMGVLNEILGAARLVLGFGRQAHSQQRFLHAFDDHIHVTLRSQTLQAAAVAFSQPVGVLAAVVAMGLAMRQGLPMAEMAGLLWSLLRAFPLLGGLLSTNVIISNFLPSYEQLVSLRDEANGLKEVEGPRIFTGLSDSIELRDVDFTYRGRESTLRGVNLRIAKGHTTALVGESGSGKSTITDLILALQLPDRGDVLLDGIPMSQWKQNSFRELVGYVPQDPVLFHTTIRQNLLWSLPSASETDLWEACRLAHAADFVRALPQGLDTVVGDRGVRLSGGQRQRIALARALLRKPALLIMDEATSSLDTESERAIQDAIDDLGANWTILVVAHRLSTVARAHQVYVLDHGRVVEEGPYADLAQRSGGLFASMVALQQTTSQRGVARR